MLFSFAYLPYQSGDENIITDTVTHQLHYQNCSPAHTVTSIKNVAKINTEWTIFPNPVNNELNINFKQEYSKAEIKIVNILGETVLYIHSAKNGLITIDVSDLKEGLYILQVIPEYSLASQKIHTLKFIKQ